MGLLDAEYSPDDEDSGWDFSDLFSSDDNESEYYYNPDDGLDADGDNSGSTFWDWTEDDEDEDYSDTDTYSWLSGGDSEDSEEETDEDEESLLDKVPEGTWSTLLDAAAGGLGEWLNQKDDEKKKKPTVKPKSRGGGGSTKIDPVDAVTKANTIGTRMKG